MNLGALAGAGFAVGAVYAAAHARVSWLDRARTTSTTRTRSEVFASFAAGCLLVASVQPLVDVLHLSRLELFLALWSLCFVIGFLLIAIEAAVFTAGPAPLRPVHLLGALGLTAVASGIVAALVEPAATGSLVQNFQRSVASLGTGQWWLRIALAAVVYMVAYCVLGSITWYFVKPYYDDPKLGLKLRVPGGKVIITLQLGRGLAATLALLPLIVSVGIERAVWWPQMALALAMVGAVVPLVNAHDWPLRLRIAHALEID